jgi:flagellar motor switch protein FliN/FliY
MATPSESKSIAEAESFGMLMHLPIRLSVELGTCTMAIAELLKLGSGSIVELDRAVHHPVDLLVNGRAVARGEVVAIEESFGLRITELIPSSKS